MITVMMVMIMVMMIKKKMMTMVKMMMTFAAERTLGWTCLQSTSSADVTTAFHLTTLSEKGHPDDDDDGHNNDSLMLGFL